MFYLYLKNEKRKLTNNFNNLISWLNSSSASFSSCSSGNFSGKVFLDNKRAEMFYISPKGEFFARIKVMKRPKKIIKKTAREIQDNIFRKMSAERKIKLSCELSSLCLKLNSFNGNNKPRKTFLHNS